MAGIIAGGVVGALLMAAIAYIVGVRRAEKRHDQRKDEVETPNNNHQPEVVESRSSSVPLAQAAILETMSISGRINPNPNDEGDLPYKIQGDRDPAESTIHPTTVGPPRQPEEEYASV